jgi:transposase InsO family protein
VVELTQVTGSQRKALALAGVARSTWQYRHHPRPKVNDPIPHHERDSPTRVSAHDRERIEEFILAGWARDESVEHSFAAAWDQGVMLASVRTWWRIGAELEQSLRPKIPTKRGRGGPRQVPVVSATRPGQAWSWDITDLLTPWRSVVLKAYKITDIYSREIVGYRVEEREADHLAVDMFKTAIAQHGAPEVVHADSGPAMRSNTLGQTLADYGVRLSHNRPYVSNDNPFSEAGFRTMKYRPGYPRVFADLDTARAYLDDYVSWYNTSHRHSGIALFTPRQVGDGTWRHTWNIRDKALQQYYERHPQRFRKKPQTPAPSDTVGINLPKNTTTK